MQVLLHFQLDWKITNSILKYFVACLFVPRNYHTFQYVIVATQINNIKCYRGYILLWAAYVFCSSSEIFKNVMVAISQTALFDVLLQLQVGAQSYNFYPAPVITHPDTNLEFKLGQFINYLQHNKKQQGTANLLAMGVANQGSRLYNSFDVNGCTAGFTVSRSKRQQDATRETENSMRMISVPLLFNIC